MRWRPGSRRSSMALAAALWSSACASGVEDDLVPVITVPQPSTGVDSGVPEASAPAAVLPPWLSDPNFEAGVPDVVSSPEPDPDSTGTTPPSSTVDAARPAARPSDAGARPTTDAGARPGGSTGTTRCQASSCTNMCSLAGPLRCCTDQGRCGCTWAPGAYCL